MRPLLRRLARTQLLCALACAHAPQRPPPPAGYGISRTQAVEVCFVPGETAYLKALRCPNGEPLRSDRLGPVGTRTKTPDVNDPRALQQMDPALQLGPGEPDLHIVDAFRIDCGPMALTIYIDMYHCGAPRPEDAPEGLRIEW
jgi:hypothetical protein